ncbi:hypothetical protein HU200_017091 [Digitaria exilis]|uniref:Uncharacterized protein n=1 Tax=Digitaria exilis TaxID=1010633 RepID=A0A835F6S7_9POAL|nr:hypothetical protein HU200_017091 [Digitaria exilis]
MLFYVREKVRSSVIHKDNGAASLSEKDIISGKIACMNDAIRNGLVEKAFDFSTIAIEGMKLQKHDPDNGQPCGISATSQDQGSNEHSNIEVIDASTSQNNEPAQKAPHTLPDGVDTLSTKSEQITLGLQRETMSPGQPDVCILVMKSEKMNPDDGQPSIISTTSQDQCSNEQGSTEVTKVSTSQNNDPVQKATCSDLDGTASTKTEQIAPVSQRETTYTAQPDACILCDVSSDQKAYEKPLQELQLEPDGALPDSGKDTPVSAFQLCNGADDHAVSNGTITDNEYSINGEAKGTEPVEPHDGLIVVKELCEKNIDDKVEAGSSGISRNSHRRKRSRNTASSEDAVQMYHKKQNLGSCAAELTMDKKGSKHATLAGVELASSCPSSVSNPDSGKCGGTDQKGSWHFNLLTMGLRVPRWDDDDIPNPKAAELQHSSSTSIGYVLDERDEEYDRGRRKKVRKSLRDFSGPNPFQEMENIRSRQRRRLQADQARSGHQPLRI